MVGFKTYQVWIISPFSPKNMRICIVGTAHPLRGGLASFNERLAQELQQQQCQVTIYTFSLQYPKLLFPGKTQYSSDAAPQGLDIKVCVNSINPLNWLGVARKIAREKPDLLIFKFWLPFMGPCFGSIARLVCRNTSNTRVCCILDNVIPHERRPGDSLFTQYFLNACHTFVAMSQDVMNDLRLFTSKQAKLLPHPIYDNFGEPTEQKNAREYLKLDPTANYLLFFGIIRRYKGLDLLLEAMADKRLQQRDIRLIVAGEFYEDPNPYNALIDRHNLHNRLVLHPQFIANDQVRYYFGACNLVVQPYRNATQSGISQMAYHFEKPMIVTNVGGLPEIVPDQKVGYVVTPTPSAIADAVVRFFDEQKADEFTLNVKAEKQRYQWNNFVQQLLEMNASDLQMSASFTNKPKHL